MITANDKQTQEAVDIVLDTMRSMKKIVDADFAPAAMKKEAANTIANLASALDTRPRFVFGDINSAMEDGAEGAG